MKFRIALFLGTLSLSLCASADQAEQIEELLAMSSADRRAALKAIPASERQGLWFAVKRAQHAQSASAKSGGAERAGKRAQNKKGPGQQGAAKGPVLGSIQYDDGTGSTTFLEANTQAIIGNRFNTHTGAPVLTSGTIDTVQAVFMPGATATTQSAGFVVLGPQTMSGGAMAIFSTFTSAGTGMTETVTYTGLGVNYTGSSFFVLFGNFDASYVPVFGTGTTNGQGHHGVSGNTGGMGPNITATTPISGFNALARTTGSILPVELMQFTVD